MFETSLVNGNRSSPIAGEDCKLISAPVAAQAPSTFSIPLITSPSRCDHLVFDSCLTNATSSIASGCYCGHGEIYRKFSSGDNLPVESRRVASLSSNSLLPIENLPAYQAKIPPVAVKVGELRVTSLETSRSSSPLKASAPCFLPGKRIKGNL